MQTWGPRGPAKKPTGRDSTWHMALSLSVPLEQPPHTLGTLKISQCGNQHSQVQAYRGKCFISLAASFLLHLFFNIFI